MRGRLTGYLNDNRDVIDVSPPTGETDPDRAELYRLEDWRIESFALDFAQGLKMDGGMNLETAWASVTVRPRSGGAPAKSARKVTEVHLPLLSAPTAMVGTPVPLA